MRKLIIVVVLMLGISAARAQERVPREQCMKAVAQLAVDLKTLLDTPIPTDPDLKRPVALTAGNRAALVLPECKLSPDTLTKAGTVVVPVGQLWLNKVVLLKDGQPVKPDQLRQVTVAGDPQGRILSLHALAMQKDAAGKWELLVYGKDPQPLLRAPVQETAAATVQREEPIDLTAVGQGDSGILRVDILGRYQAALSLGAAE